MNLSQPLATVSPGLHGRVLAVLARTDKPLTGRTVASLAQPHTSLRGVQVTLDDLVANGVVSRERVGRAYLYTLNLDHLAVAPILALANMRTELLERTSAEISAWDPVPDAVWLFGSVARGEADTDGDVDLLVVRPDTVDQDLPAWLEQVDALSGQITRWTGNGCEVLEFSSSELAVAVVRDERLVADLRRDAVPLAGAQPRALLRKKAVP
jgi:predicted nucleotidyltransferase